MDDSWNRRIQEMVERASRHKNPKDMATYMTRWNDLPSNWIYELMNVIGERSLEMICMPRSHDAGMYKINSLARWASESTVRTQTKDILSQLRSGVRVFDIRPVIRGGKIYCGHYTYIESLESEALIEAVETALRHGGDAVTVDQFFEHYHGGDGASLDEVIYQVNEFTKDHKELIILELSHAFNFDREVRGSQWGCQFNQVEWDKVLTSLQRLDSLYMPKEGVDFPTSTAAVDTPITKMRLTKLMRAGEPVVSRSQVIVTVDRADGISLGAFAGKGFFNKLDSQRNLSLTHTQSNEEAILAFLYDQGLHGFVWELVRTIKGWVESDVEEPLYSITDVARKIRREDLPKVLPAIDKNTMPMTEKTYPNLISMDDICGQSLAWVVMDVNGKIIHGRNMTLDLSHPNPGAGSWQWH